MRDDHLKRHKSLKHGDIDNNIGNRSDHLQQVKHEIPMRDVQQKELNEKTFYSKDKMQVKGCNVKEVVESLENFENGNTGLEFELLRDNETYKKNVEIGKQIENISNTRDILEKSLSKQVLFRSVPSTATNYK